MSLGPGTWLGLDTANYKSQNVVGERNKRPSQCQSREEGRRQSHIYIVIERRPVQDT